MPRISKCESCGKSSIGPCGHCTEKDRDELAEALYALWYEIGSDPQALACIDRRDMDRAKEILKKVGKIPE